MHINTTFLLGILLTAYAHHSWCLQNTETTHPLPFHTKTLLWELHILGNQRLDKIYSWPCDLYAPNWDALWEGKEKDLLGPINDHEVAIGTPAAVIIKDIKTGTEIVYPCPRVSLKKCFLHAPYTTLAAFLKVQQLRMLCAAHQQLTPPPIKCPKTPSTAHEYAFSWQHQYTMRSIASHGLPFKGQPAHDYKKRLVLCGGNKQIPTMVTSDQYRSEWKQHTIHPLVTISVGSATLGALLWALKHGKL